MIIVTAGHVDHGKTSLLRALTGTDTDRLPEEKRRGMTVDLGYAYLPVLGEAEGETEILGFVDVPGHEKFLANMLAGVGGVQHALLVVACDDGIMPQTEEHLAILHLLRLNDLTVVLTKIDKVDATRRAEVRNAVTQRLAHSQWPDATVLEASAITGDGIDALQTHLHALVRQQRISPTATAQRFRLAIDRAFHVHGAGLIVTGTAFGGSVRLGDTLWLTGAEQSVRVRNLHAQDRPTDIAHAGQRIALNLVGTLHKDDIHRGDWLLSEAPPPAVHRCLIDLETLAPDTPLQQWQSVHIHHAASHTTGRLSLLHETQGGESSHTPSITGSTLAELVLDAPLHLVDNDVLIVRDISARRTLAGAHVLSLTPPRRGKRQPAFLHWLIRRARVAGHRDVLALWLQQGYVSLSTFGWARQIDNMSLQTLLAAQNALVKSDYAMDRVLADQQCESLLSALAENHEQHPEHLGIGRARLRRMALPNTPEALVFAHVDRLLDEKQLINTHGWLHLPQHRLAFTPEEETLWQKMVPLFQAPPCWARDLAHHAQIPEADARALLHKATRLGRVTAIVRDRYYLAEQIAQLADRVRESVAENAASSETAELRDRLDVGRKLAIQILEFFDRSGFTRRQGNRHMLRDADLFTGKEER